MGVPPALAAEGLAQVAVPGRMQRVERGQPFLAVVDYAHKPAAVAALLDALRAQVPGRLLVVLGAGGDRDRAKRPLMGAAAAARADVLVVTDDNPRGEDAAAIRAAVLAGARDEPHRASSWRSATGPRPSPPPSNGRGPATPWSWPERDTRPDRRSASVGLPFDDAAASSPRAIARRGARMIEMTLAEVAAATGGRLHRATGDERVDHVEFDSRTVGPRGLFLALPGERVDGHDFAAAALAAGAAGCWRRGRSPLPR